MCKVGDIIVINNYKDSGIAIDKHSFVVLNIENNQIKGLDYDLVCNVMSSFKTEEHKKRKMKYPGNFSISFNDKTMLPGYNTKDGYIKAEQFYYFKKNKIDYKVIGAINKDVFYSLIKFIKSLDIDIRSVTDNLE